MKWNGLVASLFPDKAILENIWNIWDEHPYNNSKPASCDCEKPCGSEDQFDQGQSVQVIQGQEPSHFLKSAGEHPMFNPTFRKIQEIG